jgi:hypothetical protein
MVTIAEGRIRMRESSLREEQMSDVTATVDEASRWAAELTRMESRGPGDIPNAWQRLERRYGVPTRTFWALRYRRPKDLWASVYLKLRAAYQAECARQFERLKNELEITRAIAGPDAPSVVAAEAVVGPVLRAMEAQAREASLAVDGPPQMIGDNDGGNRMGLGRRPGVA